VFAFLICSVGATFSTYSSLTSVTLTNLSVARLDCIMHDYMKHVSRCCSSSKSSNNSNNIDNYNNVDKILSPTDLLHMEEYLSSPKINIPQATVGLDLNEVLKSSNELISLLKIFQHDNYLLNINYKLNNAKINILFKENADKKDILKGKFNIHLY
jgi:hypothetical protein